MVIIKKQDTEVIIKQLTDLLNKSFEHSLDKTIQNQNSVRTIKNSNNQKESTEEGIVLTRFITDWITNTYYDSFSRYANLMNSNYYRQFFGTFEERERPYSDLVRKVLRNSELKKEELLLLEQTIIPLTTRVKAHHSSIEESLLAVVKPFLINEFLELLMNKLDTTVELLSMVNHYNDYDYQFERFIKSFEENLPKKWDEKKPLDLIDVWWLDETFLKETIIPELKKRTLTDDQKQKAGINKRCSELVNNYYDYCLYFAFAEDYDGVSEALVDTVLLYEKEDCVQAMTLIKKALSVNYEFDSWDVREIEESLLDDVGGKKPEWWDALRPLLSGY